MRIWRRQKVIGFDVCKIVILTGHDIQMTWQASISEKACVSTSQPGLSDDAGFSSWVSNLGVFGSQSFPRFLSTQTSSRPSAVSTVWKWKRFSSLYFRISDHQRLKSAAWGRVRQSLSQSTPPPRLPCPCSLLRPVPFIIPCCVLCGALRPPGLSSAPQ